MTDIDEKKLASYLSNKNRPSTQNDKLGAFQLAYTYMTADIDSASFFTRLFHAVKPRSKIPMRK